MTDQEVTQEQLTPEPTTELAPPEQETITGAQEQPKEETNAERNFKALREAKQRIERERDDAIKRIQELQQQTQGKQQSKETLQEENELMINPDDLVEGKHLSYFQKKIKQLEAQVNNYQRSSTESQVETRLRTEYPDFDKVVTKDNVELLRELDPELAETLHSSQNLYAKAKVAYNSIKRLGIYSDNQYDNQKQRAEQNLNKPKPLTAVAAQEGSSPLSKANAFANGLTPELKEQLYKEMMEARKNL